jgi:hydrogenase maturation protease
LITIDQPDLSDQTDQSDSTKSALKKINVVGLGNLLFGDEGFGVEAMRSLEASGTYPESVSFVDGGTQGLYLLDYFESCDRLLVFDSIIPREFEPRVYQYRNDELPAFIHRKMSSHQMGLSELLGVARLHDKLPGEIVLIGAPPQNLDLGSGLSDVMRRHLEEAVSQGRALLEEWMRA